MSSENLGSLQGDDEPGSTSPSQSTNNSRLTSPLLLDDIMSQLKTDAQGLNLNGRGTTKSVNLSENVDERA